MQSSLLASLILGICVVQSASIHAQTFKLDQKNRDPSSELPSSEGRWSNPALSGSADPFEADRASGRDAFDRQVDAQKKAREGDLDREELLNGGRSKSQTPSLNSEYDELVKGQGFSPRLFYDANTFGFDRKNDTTLFEGDVVVIGAQTIVSADLMTVNKNENSFNASGHVVLLSEGQLFTGDRLKYFWESGDLKIDNASLVAKDAAKIATISDKVLGITPQELFFERQRLDRLKFLKDKKTKILEDHAENAVFGVPPSDKIVDRFALILEQEDLVREIPNVALSKLSKKRRESFERRREFWEQSRGGSDRGGSATVDLGDGGYFRLRGAVLERTNGNDYRAIEADWTPCRCEEDEEPTWSFRAERIEAQWGGYVDFTDAVLEIKGIPILYLPHLKVPLKGTRQSGFLFPTLRTGDQKHGTVYTQPVYFAFANNFDSTLTTDFFQERGTRVGLETRYKLREHSGFRLLFDTIRDKTWIDQRHLREKITEQINHDDPEIGLDCDAQQKSEDQERECDAAYDRLTIPPNTWRGTQEWDGQLFLTPRVSLVTKGTVRSDHRYVEDLQLADEFEAAFGSNLFSNHYNMVKGRVSYDGSDAYLGVSGAYGDNVLIGAERFTGMQIPGRIDFASRHYNINPWGLLPMPVYVNADYQFIPIQERNAEILEGTDKVTLGSGSWQRAAFNFVTPLKSDGIVTADYFHDFEARRIKHSGPGEKINLIRSYRTGVTFRLPMDGIGVIPEFLNFDDDQDSRRYVQHIMNWNLTLSSRPVVIRDGDYGYYGDGYTEDTPTAGTPNMVYFASDRPLFSEFDEKASYEHSMVLHRQIRLETTHWWKTFKKQWKTELAEVDQSSREESTKTYRQRALMALMYSQDRLIDSPEEMFSRADRQNRPSLGGDEPLPTTFQPSEDVVWHINRYKLVDQEVREPMSFSASMDFDFEREKRRQEQIERNRALEAEGGPNHPNITPYADLERAWLGPRVAGGISWGGYGLSARAEYDMYLRTSREMEFGLGVPSFLGLSFYFRYEIGKEITFNREQGANLTRKTKKNTIEMRTGLIPKIGTEVKYFKKSVDGEAKDTYESNLGLTYVDDSGCWGLRFLRRKLENQEERDANYLLELTVLFFGQRRGQDISPSLRRELGYN